MSPDRLAEIRRPTVLELRVLERLWNGLIKLERFERRWIREALDKQADAELGTSAQPGNEP